MLTIKCDKCDYESSNEFAFNLRHFTFLNKDNALILCHLCNGCQDKLDAAIDTAIAAFLGEEAVSGWTSSRGVV